MPTIFIFKNKLYVSKILILNKYMKFKTQNKNLSAQILLHGFDHTQHNLVYICVHISF